MTTTTTDRARLEELLGEYWEIAFEESSGVAATGNKANRVLHEIRALFDALAAPATAPEKTVKEIMEFARHYAANTFSSATLEDKIRRSLAAPATAPDQAFVCTLGCTTECLARQHGVPSECPSLPRQPATAPERKPKPFIGTRNAIYKCTDCGHEQSVMEFHTEHGVYVGSGANWCDKCELGKPERKEQP